MLVAGTASAFGVGVVAGTSTLGAAGADLGAVGHRGNRSDTDGDTNRSDTDYRDDGNSSPNRS